MVYWLIDLGSEWWFYWEWFVVSVFFDLFGVGFELVEIYKLYCCYDWLFVYKCVLFVYL